MNLSFSRFFWVEQKHMVGWASHVYWLRHPLRRRAPSESGSRTSLLIIPAREELTGVQPLERTRPGLPLTPGNVERRECE